MILSDEQLARYQTHFATLKLYTVITHARSGLAFFKRIFDSHPEILTVPILFYEYHDLKLLFGETATVTGNKAYVWLLKEGQFACIGNDMNAFFREKFVSMGDDPDAPLDRAMVREVLGRLLNHDRQVSRKDVLLATHIAYACGRGVDIFKLKGILTADSVSKPEDRFCIDWSGEDFGDRCIIHLVRDPRANYSSIRNVYANSYGSLYPVRSFQNLYQRTGSNAVWLWTLVKTFVGAEEMNVFRRKLGPDLFCTLKNEDLNSDFVSTMRRLTQWMGAAWNPVWDDVDYVPTAMGRPWQGFSAYSTVSETESNGPFRSDMRQNLRQGKPGAAVTKRWSQFLTPREVKILEAVYHDEMTALGYKMEYNNDGRPGWLKLFLLVMLPMSGELPGWQWLKSIRRERRAKDLLVRLAYYPLLPLFYIWSRAAFFYHLSIGKLRSRTQYQTPDELMGKAANTEPVHLVSREKMAVSGN